MAYDFNFKKTWAEQSPARLETSYAVLDHADSTEMNFSIGIDDKAQYGYFELYDVPTGGNRFHAEGGLWFEGKKLTEYDGVFSLSPQIIRELKTAGYDVSEMETT